MIQEAVEILKTTGPISGLANCHLPGIYSLVLKPRKDAKDGMLRIFYATERNLNDIEDSTDFKVMPHNHRQDITLYRLFGKATNARLILGGGALQYEYAFESALLNGQFGLTKRGWRSGSFKYEEITPEGLYLKWSDVHTVVAQPESAWVVKEGELAPEPYLSLSYSRSMSKQLSSEGLYRKMGAGELRMVSGWILTHLQ